MTDEMIVLRSADPARQHSFLDPAAAARVRTVVHAREGLSARTGRARHGRRRRLTPALLIGVAAATVVAVLLVSAGSTPQRALALPVLSRPAIDATGLGLGNNPLLQRNRADLKDARAISTPNGAAYAIPTANGGMCLTVPDPAGGYGASCASQTEIQRRGLVAGVIASHPGEQSDFVVVIPADSGVVVYKADGDTTTLPSDRGVVASAIGDGERAVLRINGSEIPLTPPVDPRNLRGEVGCDDGTRLVPIPAGTSPSEYPSLCDKQP
jgi:hypothetical protein